MHRLPAAMLALALVSGPALATPEYLLPTLFDVTGVSADDSLNIRERPDAGAPIIGTLPPDARGVEVVAERSGWAQVNTAERSGWVNARYLAYQTGTWEPGSLPPALTCAGTEPFWSLRQVGEALVYETPEGARQLQRRAVMDQGFRSPVRGIIAGDDAGRLTVAIQPAQCSDGMSDRSYGLSAMLIFDGAGQASSMQTGCCRISP